MKSFAHILDLLAFYHAGSQQKQEVYEVECLPSPSYANRTTIRQIRRTSNTSLRCQPSPSIKWREILVAAVGFAAGACPKATQTMGRCRC